MKIGVFDSGFGGIEILKHIKSELHEFDYVYLGDTARTPYGTRTQEKVLEYTKQAIDFLVSKDCSLIIIACNTASAEALHTIQTEYLPEKYPDTKVLGVIIPATEEAAKITKNKRVGVLATKSSVESKTFEKELLKLSREIETFQNPAPLLVPIVESGERDKVIISTAISNYLKPLLENRIDTLILGCTHYGILLPYFEQILKNTGVQIINEGEIVSKKLREYLKKHKEITGKISRNGSMEFYTTDLTDTFKELGSKFFDQKISAQKISLE